MPPNDIRNTAELKGFANANNFSGSFKTSAKSGLNISESMDYLIKIIINRLTKINEEMNPEKSSISIDPGKYALTDSFRAKPKTGCC